MKSHIKLPVLASLVMIGACAVVLPALTQDSPRPAAPSSREDAYRANNIGVALLEQFNYKDAVESFRRALALDPKLAIARTNLAIALYNLPDIPASLAEARRAADLMPDAPQPHYMLGLIARTQNRFDDATRSFQQVLRIDPRDVGANVNLAQLYMQQRKYQEALGLLRTAIESEPYNVTATYNLAISLLRSGQREEGQRFMQKFQSLRDSNYGTVIGLNYLEQGRYSEAVSSTGAEAELVDAATPDVKFIDSTQSALPKPGGDKTRQGAASPFGRSLRVSELVASLSGDVAMIDYDGDGDLDLFEVGPAVRRLYRNDGGKFIDVTEGSGLASEPGKSIGISAVAGDYDNDSRPDLFVLGPGGLSLYRNEGGGKFSDQTSAASLPAYPHLALSAAFVDIDHDGDLDIFIAGLADLTKLPSSADAQLRFPDDFPGAPNLLLRNNGNGKFTDITATAQVAGKLTRAVAVVPTDYDNRRDIDLLIVNYGAAPTLFRNLRDGTFSDVAESVGLTARGNFTCAAAADVNKDGFTDFFLGRSDGAGVFALSDGQGRFTTQDAPSATDRATAAQFLDYDNDGLIDLVALSSAGLGVVRNLGSRWSDVSGQAAAPGLLAGHSRSFASGDTDADGDTDLIARLSSGEMKAARNEGGNRNHSLRVSLTAKVSNRSSVASKVEARAGSLRQKLETYAASPAPAPADLIFGLGARASVDAVRVLWPAGIVQAETEIARSARKLSAVATALAVTEIDRKPSSCPYLYTWNGERFEFITDFMGGGEMGYWVAPGVRNDPDPDEYVRIRGDQLKPRDGRYEIRVTNELEEALFVDRLQLVAIGHPEGTEVFPNEGLVGPPRPPFKLYVTRDLRPPASATDHHGHDVLDRITHIDRKYPDDFQLHRIRGYAKEHALTLDLGETSITRTLLLLTGWTDYSFSSDNVAAHQAGLGLKPPALQVKDSRGEWKTLIDNIGFPVGRPQTIVVDLTGKLPARAREVRIVTNMRIYWDQVLVDTSEGGFPFEMTRLEAARAELRWRGFSAEVTPDGREPFGYDYDRVSLTSPWKVMPGRYTREG
ncbi:MAG TPA: FG-GAP-like repeat-containing protein, partial [Blastocatellia bacterium]|nr:FG-GAP-like repeat-containing protein [Blastocatellia bacterium]